MPSMRLIAGSGRSGTTWVLDALAHANGLRPVFEPLHPYVSDIGDRYAHRALTSDEEHPELAQFLAEVCAGRRIALWTKYRRQLRWLLPPPADFSTRRDAGRVWRHWNKLFREIPVLATASRRREPIVKCIRANLMLDWLSRGQSWRVVLIVRHPGAVIESELRGSWNASFALDRFRNDARLHELTNGRYVQLLEQKLTPVEALAARWVIENQWVVERARFNRVTVVHYEQLRASPEPTWAQVVDALGLTAAPDAASLSKPSQQSSPNRFGAPVTSPRTRWQRVLTADQTDSIQRVLDEVQCDMYSMSRPEPLASAALPQAAAEARAGA